VDNITTKFYSDTCGDVFDGNDGMAGLKRYNLEGGVRLPAFMRWPGRIPARSVSNRLSANYDFLATAAELAGVACPPGKDGRSFLQAVLSNDKDRQNHDYVVFASFQGPALVMADGWKLRYVTMNDSYQLYYLPDDYREEHDKAGERPDKVGALREILLRECDGNLKYGHAQTQKVDYGADV
jgi:arylsulfatase A-like enzyme